MAFDMGWNCRSSSGYVTDPSYAVPCLSEQYPNTYTNGDGKSINAGYSSIFGAGTPLKGDRDNTNDPRLAGVNEYDNYGSDTLKVVFRIDLDSGSAPGVGGYSFDAAFGSATSTRVQNFRVLDNTTVLLDATNGGSGFSTIADHYIDATLTDVAATTSWTGTPVPLTFASTTAYLEMGRFVSTGQWSVAHFRLILTATGGTQLRSMLMLMGVGS